MLTDSEKTLKKEKYNRLIFIALGIIVVLYALSAYITQVKGPIYNPETQQIKNSEKEDDIIFKFVSINDPIYSERYGRSGITEVTWEIENQSKEEIIVSNTDVKVIDDRGAKFSGSNTGPDKMYTGRVKIQPYQKFTFKTWFSIPNAAKKPLIISYNGMELPLP